MVSSSCGGAPSPSSAGALDHAASFRITSGSVAPPSSIGELPVMGRLRVRCVSAQNLAAGDRHVVPAWSSSDPYVVLQLQDSLELPQSAKRRTKTLNKTLNPEWNEEFRFSVRACPDDLLLHIDVYDHDHGKEDDFLGQASMPLRPLMLAAGGDRCLVKKDLRLQADPVRSHLKVQGCVKLEICWEPAVHLMDTGVVDLVKTVAHVVSRSPAALQFLRVALLGVACGLFLVAAGAPWICRGPSFENCQGEDLPAATGSSVLAGITSFFCAALHFCGAAGCFGRAWRYDALNLIDLAEADLEEGIAASGSPTAAGGHRPTIRVHVQPGMQGWSISFTTAFWSGTSLSPMYLLAFFLHLAAAGLCLLALLLAWLHGGSGALLADAVYLDVAALICLAASAAISSRERRLLAEAEHSRWRALGDPTAPSPVSPDDGTDSVTTYEDHFGDTHSFGSFASFKEFSAKLKQGVQRLTPSASVAAGGLARPLLSMRDTLSDSVVGHNVERRHFFQEQWDDVAAKGVAPLPPQETLRPEQHEAQEQSLPPTLHDTGATHEKVPAELPQLPIVGADVLSPLEPQIAMDTPLARSAGAQCWGWSM